MNPVTITDTHGDSLTVQEYAGCLYIEADATENEFDRDEARELRDAINEYLSEEPEDEGDAPTANEAKLRLAAQYGLKTKFAYAGERDYRAVERRLVPDTVEERQGVVYVTGESFDEGGVSQGLRQFRLDRISGEVVVR